MLLRLPIQERSQAAEARRLVAGLARTLGFDEKQTGELAIVATELATNLVNHAQRGELLVQASDPSAIELISVDRGPGMDLARCLEDGYSTGGTAGQGLGAVRRLSSRFDAWSDAGGSVVASRMERSKPRGKRALDVAGVCVPISGESLCGDAYTVRDTDEGTAILIADGLGHGPFAADAAQRACSVFHELTWRGAADAIEHLHAGLRGTRGAALSVTAIDFGRRSIRFSGLGNTSGVILSDGRSQSMVSHNGTAGHNATRIAEFEYQWPEHSTVVLHTDGLTTSWTVSRYSGLLGHSPLVISGVLYRDFARGRDDCAVIAAVESLP